MSFVYLSNSHADNNLDFGKDGLRTQYIVRKVIPESLIYLDSLPRSMFGKPGVWSGHNVMSMRPVGKGTAVSVFMEHTWFSEAIPIEQLRSDAREIMFGAAVDFWRDFFIPDLLSLIRAKK